MAWPPCTGTLEQISTNIVIQVHGGEYTMGNSPSKIKVPSFQIERKNLSFQRNIA